jgi:hypothetical protein
MEGVEYWYQCQTGPQYDSKHVYTKESIDHLITRIQNREENYYGHTDTFLYRYNSLPYLLFFGQDQVKKQ